MSNFTRTISILFITSSNLFAQTTFTSTQSGDWDNCLTWGFGGGCTTTLGVTYPDLDDSVVISSGHQVGITTHNGNKPSDFGVNTNVTGSGDDVFLHQGYIYVEGTLDVQPGFMITDQIDVVGTLKIDGDLFTTGKINIEEGAARFDVGDDFVLAGNSETNVNINSPIADDVYFDGPNALLCGTTDTLFLQSSGSTIQEFNSANASTQACDQITIINCGAGICPFTGSGTFILPVELVYFRGRKSENENILEWATASELGNDFFTVKKSEDGFNWKTLSKIDGKGTTDRQTNYSITDDTPYPNITYYLLSQTDFDGTEHVFQVISVTKLNNINAGIIQLSPNPTSDIVNLSISKTGFNIQGLELLDISGRTVTKIVVTENTLSNYMIDLKQYNLTDNLYLLRIKTNKSYSVHKLYIN